MAMKKKTKLKIGSRAPLVKNLLLVEGMSRAGKFVLANVITGFRGVEPIQYYDLLEHLPFLEKFGFIDKKAAQELIRGTIDTHCFEMLLGRNFNFRRSDLSSIFNHPLHKNYLKRVKETSWSAAWKKFKKEKPYSLFIAHELMPNIKIYFETFPNLKIISLQRSPVALVGAWLKDGVVGRFGKDPKILNILLDSKSGPTPWFANGWQDEYNSLSETDRAIKTILYFQNLCKKTYRGLNSGQKKKILLIRFENVLFDTTATVKKIGKFLKRDTLPGIKKIYKNLILPRPAHLASHEEVIKKIKETASSKYTKLLLAAERAYCSQK